ncbi:MAG: Exodeoxyribonuclease 7 large subunit [Patescibacteria group bacterium]|nr:Exodeoxyribonuclease 7 large subunit [Patescibacteria group bacterium]
MNPSFSVSDFVAVFNQTIDYVYPSVTIVGELANFRISKGKWVYFDLKDETASIRFFGSIYCLPGPLEDGMMIQVVGAPRLHQTFGFSVTIKSILPVGEGSIKKATDLLRAKLTKEGLFLADRKRTIPYPPKRIGLVASGESAAFKDFIKVLNSRWGGIEIIHADVQVQGEIAPGQIIDAISALNNNSLDAIIITRGGGSADDLVAFSSEQVVRAVASSRTPTMVAIGHEVDESLSELAADVRASTPSNAAELLVPDRNASILQTKANLNNTHKRLLSSLVTQRELIVQHRQSISASIKSLVNSQLRTVDAARQLLVSYDPRQILKRGYAIVKQNGVVASSIKQLKHGDIISLTLSDGTANAVIENVQGDTIRSDDSQK